MSELYRFQRKGVKKIQRFDGRALLADEVWKVVPGFRKRYRVSNYGRVKSRYGRKRILKQDVIATGHSRVTLSKDGRTYRYLVHRLVLELFAGPCPEGMECRHLDGNPENNHIDNLRWGTKSDNTKDAIKHETSNVSCGELHMNSKLTWKRVRNIRKLYASGNFTQKALAGMFGVTQTNISCIVNQKIWRE